MKRNQLTILIICAVVLLGLVGLLMLLRSQDGEENLLVYSSEEDSPSGENAQPTIFSDLDVYTDQSPVTSIDIYNVYGDFTLLADNAESETPAYSIEGVTGIPLDADALAQTFSQAASLKAEEVVLEAEVGTDLDQFGLGDNAALATVHFADGSGIDLFIGNPAPGGEGIYLLSWGVDNACAAATIYLVPQMKISGYLLSSLDFVDHTVTATSGAGADYTRIALSGASRQEETVIQGFASVVENEEGGEETQTTYRITAPISRNLNTDSAPYILQSLFDITADQVEAIHPDEETLESYGLTEPYTKAEITGGPQGDVTLLLSEPDSQGKVYLYREGVPVVYSIAADSLSWYRAEYHDLASPWPVSVPIDTLAELEIRVNDASYVFTAVTLTSAVEGGGEATEYTASLNGATLDSQRYYTLLSEALDSVTTYTQGELDPEDGVLLMELRYRYNTGEPEDVIRVYEGPPRRVYIQKNGEAIRYTAPSSWLDAVTDALTAVLSSS